MSILHESVEAGALWQPRGSESAGSVRWIEAYRLNGGKELV